MHISWTSEPYAVAMSTITKVIASIINWGKLVRERERKGYKEREGQRSKGSGSLRASQGVEIERWRERRFETLNWGKGWMNAMSDDG